MRFSTMVATGVIVFGLATAAYGGPRTLTYQGNVLDPGGEPVPDGTYDMQFQLFHDETGGVAYWTETDLAVPVTNGLFSTILGDGSFFGTHFSNDFSLWLEVAIDRNGNGTFEAGEVFSPRRQLAGAAWAVEADRLQGRSAADFASATHSHPWGEITAIPAGFADGIDDDTHDWASITGIPAGFADGVDDDTHNWASLTGIPAGFADGIDDDSGGDITAVNAGTGLTGGGASGDVTLAADTTFLQRRVSQAAPAGSYIRAINPDGTIVTSPDQVGSGDITAVNAGPGITGGGAAGDVTVGLDTTYTDNRYWLLSGNAGTTPGVSFLGTTDPTPLDIRVNDTSALRIEPAGVANLIGGFDGNTVTAGVAGATIGGGGGGGGANRVTDDFGTIGGGEDNQAGDAMGSTTGPIYATVAGGVSNTASGLWSAIGGGSGNVANSNAATVGGGMSNSALGPAANVAGGSQNTANGFSATIAGGQYNQAQHNYVTVGGGRINIASGLDSTISGGREAIVLGDYATVGGGYDNEVLAAFGTIAGGGRSDPTSGPTRNRVTDEHGTIGGGGANQAGDDDASTTNAAFATVAGGLANTAGNHGAAVAGGTGNTAGGIASFVGGGEDNTANADLDTIGGGWMNIADGDGSTIGGGYANLTTGPFTTIAGGVVNQASGDVATVGGGDANLASGPYSTVPGGYGAHASNYGQIAFASGRFANAGDAQGAIYVMRNTSSGLTPVNLYLDGTGEYLTIPDNKTVLFKVQLVGRSSGNESAAYAFECAVENVAGTNSFLGSAFITFVAEDDPVWNLSISITGNRFYIGAVGNTGDTVRWVATVRATEVGW